MMANPPFPQRFPLFREISKKLTPQHRQWIFSWSNTPRTRVGGPPQTLSELEGLNGLCTTLKEAHVFIVREDFCIKRKKFLSTRLRKIVEAINLEKRVKLDLSTFVAINDHIPGLQDAFVSRARVSLQHGTVLKLTRHLHEQAQEAFEWLTSCLYYDVPEDESPLEEALEDPVEDDTEEDGSQDEEDEEDEEDGSQDEEDEEDGSSDDSGDEDEEEDEDEEDEDEEDEEEDDEEEEDAKCLLTETQPCPSRVSPTEEMLRRETRLFLYKRDIEQVKLKEVRAHLSSIFALNLYSTAKRKLRFRKVVCEVADDIQTHQDTAWTLVGSLARTPVLREEALGGPKALTRGGLDLLSQAIGQKRPCPSDAWTPIGKRFHHLTEALNVVRGD